jgi:hypothetical protein
MCIALWENALPRPILPGHHTPETIANCEDIY